MSRKRYAGEQIISKLREVEILQSNGQSTAEICSQLGIKEQTYFKWRKEYGGIRGDQAKRLKETEQEYFRLKKLVACLSLDNSILKETVPENC